MLPEGFALIEWDPSSRKRMHAGSQLMLTARAGNRGYDPYGNVRSFDRCDVYMIEEVSPGPARDRVTAMRLLAHEVASRYAAAMPEGAWLHQQPLIHQQTSAAVYVLTYQHGTATVTVCHEQPAAEAASPEGPRRYTLMIHRSHALTD